ncbi:hypothetical protein AURDEDRAFT_117985 [Auricularia subglabra TFB-10046 SS5]|uniref:Uncharacterized protein n=1 Tax=Auricularia subglabra (strain TFB-10046 / SS5) TaxID=717982 RepID=J0L894_AURST|nr:hypothetical protein AURDEDRAFT_117985 [Auricularia subglabra TFB-10046 SS5]
MACIAFLSTEWYIHSRSAARGESADNTDECQTDHEAPAPREVRLDAHAPSRGTAAGALSGCSLIRQYAVPLLDRPSVLTARLQPSIEVVDRVRGRRARGSREASAGRTAHARYAVRICRGWAGDGVEPAALRRWRCKQQASL